MKNYSKTEPFCFIQYSVHILKQTTYFYSGKALIIKKKHLVCPRAICMQIIFLNPIKVYFLIRNIPFQTHTRQINKNINYLSDELDLWEILWCYRFEIPYPTYNFFKTLNISLENQKPTRCNIKIVLNHIIIIHIHKV